MAAAPPCAVRPDFVRTLPALVLALTLAAPAAAQSLGGRWGTDPADCSDDVIAFLPGGRFEARFDGQGRAGTYRQERDRLVLLSDDGDEQVMPVLELSPQRIVLFDETIESDRRLRPCR